MDAGDGAWPHVIGKVAQHNAVRQSGSQVAGQRHLQSGLNVLGRKMKKVKEAGAEQLLQRWSKKSYVPS